MLLQRLEVLGRPLVDRVGVRIGARRQIDLGARDVQKAERVAGGERARFVGVDDVVGNGRDARRRLPASDGAHGTDTASPWA